MMQGDSYDLGIEILDDTGAAVLPEAIEDMEIVLGNIKKTHLAGEVKYGENGWLFPITQEESFAFPAGKVKGQVRVKWASGEITGCKLELLPKVEESRSKEVL